MHLYVKHAALINNCYPEREEGGSRSSELSYLTFYASSRPIKLTKVGLFLERKVERDVFKGRKKHNVVSLEILQSLIHACHRDLNLFSKHVVKILTMVLDMKDNNIELVNKACETFVDFSNYHDGNTLGVDAEFTADYELLMQQFAGYCSFQGGNETLAYRLKFVGHRGLLACVTSSAFLSSNFTTQLGIIMPPVIVTLAKSRQPVNMLAKSKTTPDLKQSDLDSDLIDGSTISICAARTASLLFGKINGTGIHLALDPLLDYLDDKEKWWPPNFAVASIELVLDSLQTQYRYLLVNELLQQIEDSARQTITSKLVSLVSILDTVLNTDLPLTGISVLEVLNSLFGHLIKSLQRGREFKMNEPSIFEGEQTTFEFVIHQGLAHSMAGLATHTYYQNQLDDITGYFLAKLRVGTTLKQVEGLPLIKYRDAVLKCLNFIVDTDNSSIKNSDTDSDELTSSSSATTISLESWVPALGILIDSEPKTRTSFAMILVRYLKLTASDDLSIDHFPKHTLNRHGDAVFVSSLQKYMLRWSTLDGSTIKDVQALYHLLCALTRRLGVDGTIKTIPLIFHLQKLVEQRDIGQAAKGRALATVIVEYFDMVGQFYHIDRLVHYINQVRTERLQNKEYSTINFGPNTPTDDSSDTCSFDDLEPENHNLVNIYVDRRAVVEILVKDSLLRDEDDVYGLGLESKLFIEWGSDAFANQERSCRIRISRNLDDIKPKLTTPCINMDFTQKTNNTKQIVKVENLKEALVSTALATEEIETYTSDLDGLSTLSSNCLTERNKKTPATLSSLLSGLKVGSTAPTSLINPPYQT